MKKYISIALILTLLFTIMGNPIIVKSSDILYDKAEDVPKELNGRKLIKVEEVVDKNDTESVTVVINHTFRFNEQLPIKIWKIRHPDYNKGTDQEWLLQIKNHETDEMLTYRDLYIKDYKIEMAVISKSGTVKLKYGDLMMNGKAITPLLVNGSIPDATAYFTGSGAIHSAWENPCWNSNPPGDAKKLKLMPPEFIENSRGKYKAIKGIDNSKYGQVYDMNSGNKYIIPPVTPFWPQAEQQGIGEENAIRFPNSSYPTDYNSPLFRKGQYATTNFEYAYGKIKYKGIYDGQPSGGGGGGGEIKFDPYETDWTNKGKTGEGSGAYPVRVYYDGDNPVTLEGTATVDTSHYETRSGTDSKGKPTTYQEWVKSSEQVTFPVTYSLESIAVTGATNETVSGISGTVNIRKEGGDLRLHGVGKWGEAKYSLPPNTISSNIPPKPNEPTGDSGIYKIDWTKTKINIDSPSSGWVNSPVPNPVTINVTDNLSGFDDNASVSVTDSSHYGNDAEDTLPVGGLSYNKTVMLDDGIYEIEVKADDRATNENSKNCETYYIDGTDPVVDFNIPPGIFAENRGAVRKASQKGSNFAFYGKLTASDNLSGVSKLQYKWTYGNNKPSSGYEVIYTSPYTYSDRYDETINREIEKPVGDNLYIHVELWDTAGNYTYRSFGPYEDPIKLKNFQVTDIRDPRWYDVFWKDKDNSYTNPTNKTYKVNDLAIDDKSHPTLKNAFPKKGYSFYFDITSEFMYREKDRIEIKPSFYYMKDGNRIPVDCYYNNNNNPLVKIGSSKDDVTLNINTKKYGDVLIGNLGMLTLTKGVRIPNGREWTGGWKDEIQYVDGKEQWWYGKYFIPASSVFVKQGDSPKPENILKDEKIVVNFQIIGYKNGIETMSTDQIFAYIPSQWRLEGGPKNKDYKDGDIIVYDNKYSVMSDYKTHIIH